MTPSNSAYQRTLLKKFQVPIYKNVEFCIFCQKTKTRLRVYLFVVFLFCFFLFPRGPRIDQVVLECRKRSHSNGNEKF